MGGQMQETSQHPETQVLTYHEAREHIEAAGIRYAAATHEAQQQLYREIARPQSRYLNAIEGATDPALRRAALEVLDRETAYAKARYVRATRCARRRKRTTEWQMKRVIRLAGRITS